MNPCTPVPSCFSVWAGLTAGNGQTWRDYKLIGGELNEHSGNETERVSDFHTDL